MGKKDKVYPGQISLFEQIKKTEWEEPTGTHGSMNINNAFRAVVSETIKGCEYSRPQLAAKMTELTGDEITLSMLNSWTAESKEQHRFPAIYIAALCYATGSAEPLKVIGQPAKLYVVESPEVVHAEVDRINKRIRKLQAEKRLREDFLREMEVKK